ncbi:MAG TPA: efflux transporter outer membrane subunit [Micropepsaceae bacterium]|nr:efflux transporter outer membrane subunit [Micropepsaceae bacterium]
MRDSIYSSISKVLLASTAAASLAGCTVLGPDFLRPTAPTVTAYTAAPLPPATVSADTPIAGDAQRFLQDNDVPGEWWTLFRSPLLNDLVTQALRANPDIDAAQATLRQAHENVIAQQGALFPQVNGTGQVGRQQSTTTRNTLDLFNASVSVSYLIDAFGGVQRSIEAQGALEENSRFTLEATYLTLTSNVITAAIQEASLSSQIAAIQDIITAQAQELDLLNQQFELGAVARGDVLAQQSQLAATQASLQPVQKQLEQVRNTLVILTGRYPSEGPVPNIELADLQLPVDLPLSLPSSLIEQRPDIRASEALLHNASAQIGVATANLFPQFTVTGSLTDSAFQVGDFFTGADTGWSVIAGLTAPIFRGGTLRAQQRAAYDVFDRSAAQYRGTVLNAFANVANVLSALQLDAENVKTQLYAEQTAEQALEITQERFQAGAIAYLSLLDAQRTYQQARIALVIAQANRFADTVALFQALGGGWWNRQDAPEFHDPKGLARIP